MITVVTLTYKRHHILEEAIESFLRQGRPDCNMLVINDAVDVTYKLLYPHPNVTVINVPKRFGSIIEKLRFAFNIAPHDYMYRLDDDDLLTEFALRDSIEAIKNNPGHDVYRSKGHYFFSNNEYGDRGSSINNGNIYTKKYIEGIVDWENKSFGEDNWLTFFHNGSVHEYDAMSMIYRWGMYTYHISGMGDVDQKEMFERVDKDMKEQGEYILVPRFIENYYEQIRTRDELAAV